MGKRAAVAVELVDIELEDHNGADRQEISERIRRVYHAEPLRQLGDEVHRWDTLACMVGDDEIVASSPILNQDM